MNTKNQNRRSRRREEAETGLLRHAKRCGVELIFDGGRGPLAVWGPGLIIAQFGADPSLIRAMIYSASQKRAASENP